MHNFRRRLSIPRPLTPTPRPLIQQRLLHNERLFTVLGATAIWSVARTQTMGHPLCHRVQSCSIGYTRMYSSMCLYIIDWNIFILLAIRYWNIFCICDVFQIFWVYKFRYFSIFVNEKCFILYILYTQMFYRLFVIRICFSHVWSVPEFFRWMLFYYIVSTTSTLFYIYFKQRMYIIYLTAGSYILLLLRL